MTTLELLEGDCLQVMAALPEKSVDCFICDLPYGCLSSNTNASQKNTGACSWDIKIDLKAFWEQVKRLKKSDNTPVLMFATTKFGNELINSNPSWFRYDLVWDKQRGVSFLSANKMPMRSHEMIYVFSKEGAYYNRVDISGNFPKWEKEEGSVRKGQQVYGNTNELKRTTCVGEEGKRCPLSVIKIKQKASYQMKGQHPTEKPIELYKWLIERYCPEGGTILDPTAGSFNSCFAAFELGRNSIGIEMNHPYFEKACKRADTLNTV